MSRISEMKNFTRKQLKSVPIKITSFVPAPRGWRAIYVSTPKNESEIPVESEVPLCGFAVTENGDIVPMAFRYYGKAEPVEDAFIVAPGQRRPAAFILAKKNSVRQKKG